MDMVDTLQEQHKASRIINREMLKLSAQGKDLGPEGRRRLLSLCGAFTNMYLPHIARENSILFPVFYDIVSSDYLVEIKKKMEDEEKKILGATGFRGLVGRLAELEKEAGTYGLSQYTARL